VGCWSVVSAVVVDVIITYSYLSLCSVLLDAYGHVKLGDFGLAKDGIRHPTQGAKSTCGTPEYMVSLEWMHILVP
jgi:hypothetical protein